MPMIRVELMEGRTDDQLRAMVERMTEALVETVNAAPSAVQIVITEVPPRHWAVAGERVADRRSASA
jgi:4-oxalocrotonate tautomerase